MSPQTALSLVVMCLTLGSSCAALRASRTEVAGERAIARVDAARPAALAGAPDAVIAFDNLILQALGYRLSADDRAGLTAGTEELWDNALALHPEARARILESRARLYLRIGKRREAVAALNAALAVEPSTRLAHELVDALDHGPDQPELLDACRTWVARTQKRPGHFDLVAACVNATNSKTNEAFLRWATAEDLKTFVQERDRSRALTDATIAANEARRGTAQVNSPAKSSGSGPAGWSITLKNECPRTVKLFVGGDPKFGSGTRSALGSNNLTSYSGTAGAKLYLVNDSDQPLASFAPSSGRVVVAASCASFRQD